MATFILPNGPIERHVDESAYIFKESGAYPTASAKYESTMDYFTDSIILTESENRTNDSLINKSMLVYRTLEDGKGTFDTLASKADGKKQTRTHEETYSRYWHGFLIYTRPLLEFFNYRTIRKIGLIAQLSLLALVIYRLIKNNRPLLAFAYVVSYLTLSVKALGYCLQYWPCTFIALIASIAVISLYERNRLTPDTIAVLFAITGATTNYFDFLTFPIITLGLPLTLALALIFHKAKFKKLVECFICPSISWAYSYGLMWFMKWTIATLTTGRNIFIEAFKAAEIRSGIANDQVISYGAVLKDNFNQFSNNPMTTVILITTTVTIIALCVGIYAKVNNPSIKMTKVLVFALTASLVFIWYRALLQHSFIHRFMVNRDCIVIMASILMGCATMIETLTRASICIRRKDDNA